ncbi:hypothetical protein ABT381_08195 [Streptomyces sp. NPDC000151]|uniref:hypothetical protein n=1 Tax=Streptomyces sp. NPDC000151 TaxID=3154244 RepID=UPI00331F8382
MLLLAVLTGLAAGVLTALSGGGLASCVLCGGGSFGVATGFFNRIVAPERADASHTSDRQRHRSPEAEAGGERTWAN